MTVRCMIIQSTTAPTERLDISQPRQIILVEGILLLADPRVQGTD